MKKTIFALVITLAVVFVFAKPKSIAVVPFDITGNAVSTDEADAITELYIAELISTGKVSVVDLANFSKILKEMEFQAGDWSKSDNISRLGASAGADIISRGQIIKIGSKIYISTTLIEAKSAKILSSEKVQVGTIDDVFGIMAEFANNAVEKLSLKIGDMGPGGGLVFYIEGNNAYECSEFLGETNWNMAKTLCSEYRGGGYDDWYLPNEDELNCIYKNLRKTGKISTDAWYWSSTESGFKNEAMIQCFSNGTIVHSKNKGDGFVRAVRKFRY